MSYRHYQPIGYLGGVDGAPDTAEEIVLRNQARSNAIAIWNEYQRFRRMGPVRELMEADPYSQGAFTDAYRKLRRAMSEHAGVRVSRREFASMVQDAMAKISLLQIKARMLSRVADIRGAYPVVERVNRAARDMLSALERLMNEAEPIRKEAANGAKGTSGLGFLPGILEIAALVIAWAVAQFYVESSTNADNALRAADAHCEAVYGRGQPCPEWHDFYAEALRLQRESGVTNLLNVTADGARQAGRGLEDLMEALKIAGITGGVVAGVALLGLGLYAVWPYVSATRGVGKRIERRARGE